MLVTVFHTIEYGARDNSIFRIFFGHHLYKFFRLLQLFLFMYDGSNLQLFYKLHIYLELSCLHNHAVARLAS